MISEIAVSYLLLYGSGNPCSCLVLHLHISGSYKSDSTLYGASPHTAAFYIQFVLASLPGSTNTGSSKRVIYSIIYNDGLNLQQQQQPVLRRLNPTLTPTPNQDERSASAPPVRIYVFKKTKTNGRHPHRFI